MNKIKGVEITQDIINRFENTIHEIIEGEHTGCHERYML